MDDLKQDGGAPQAKTLKCSSPSGDAIEVIVEGDRISVMTRSADGGQLWATDNRPPEATDSEPAERTARPLQWAVSIHATNDVINDGPFFLELARALRAYAAGLESWEYGQGAFETFETAGGTRLVVMAEQYSTSPVRL